jgi:hypothetical protein
VLTTGLAILYLPLHFAAYALFFRRHSFFRTEKGIFLLHFASASVLPVVVFALSLDSGLWVALLCCAAAVAAHGIYSISFLELWSLAEGSYSLTILRVIDSRASPTVDAVSAELGAVGDRKKGHRLASLERLRLVKKEGQTVSLTSHGRYLSVFLRGLQSLANIGEAG